MTVVPALVATPMLALIAFGDVRHHRIRNRDLAVLTAVTVAGLGAAAAAAGASVVADAAAGAMLAALPLAVAGLVQPARMGGGDVKLAALLGALLGPLDLWLVVATVGAALAVTLVAARRGPAPLAPALVGAALLTAGVYAVSG
ncbi:MAG: prepilin peptidase [Acidimicrobiia bacterium]